ncbi:MAG: cadherin-like beta sandwich domain-containing protein [Mogibacterium sp.]|nr:cadherin-like beta sandwich domain-containing protein [Mogibacterium sp.]
MILPMNYSRTSSDTRMTAADMNRICTNVNEVCGSSLKTNWTSDDIVDESTWHAICDLAAALGRFTVTYGTDYRNVNRIEQSLFEQYDETAHITATAKLTGLAISNGTLSPAFNSSTYSYTATVAAASSAITATTDYSAIGYKVNGSVVDPSAVVWQNGTNTLQVTATLNGVTRTYTVTVTCTYQAAELLTLSVGGNAVTISDYMTITTDNASDLIAYTANGTVTLELNGEEVTGSTLTWRENDNTLKITVTASNTKVYTLAVDCLYVAPIPAYLAGITISDAIMTPAYSGSTLSYVVYPEGDTSTIEAIMEGDADVTIRFNGTEIVNGSEIEWTDGGGDVITIVTSGTGYTSVTYTVTARAEIVTEALAPMRSGEIISGNALPGEGFE